MATKKDLIEAQNFSQRRLLTAFTSGAPGGKELEPAKPLRAVTAGIALAAMLVLGGVFYGLIRPGLPEGWENNKLIVTNDTGARYVSVQGVLYPVINTASARLLIPAGEFSVITTDQSSLDGIEIGPSIGIVGAPDALPDAGALLAEGWAGCVTEGAGAVLLLDPGLDVDPTPTGAVVRRGSDIFVVAGGLRYQVDGSATDAVLRATGVDTASVVNVDGRWLNLFLPGADLEPLRIPGAGQTVPGTGLDVGVVVHAEGTADDDRYVVTAAGELAPLTPLGYQLYLLGTGSDLGPAREVSPAELAGIATGEPAGGADWPAEELQPWSTADGPVCALLTGKTEPQTVLGRLAPGAELPTGATGVHVAFGHGALFRIGGVASGDGLVYLVDETGVAFGIPSAGADADAIARLGYAADDIVTVPAGWLQFFASGPVLSAAAAASTPAGTGEGSGPTPGPIEPAPDATDPGEGP